LSFSTVAQRDVSSGGRPKIPCHSSAANAKAQSILPVVAERPRFSGRTMKCSPGRGETAGRFGTKAETTMEGRITQDEHGLKTCRPRSCQCCPHERAADTGLLAIRSDRNRPEPECREWCLQSCGRSTSATDFRVAVACAPSSTQPIRGSLRERRATKARQP
jgi:hypothetical protein